MIYAYVRVSTVEQNEARQIEAMGNFNIDEWFIEKISGKNTNRPELQRLLSVAKAGDTIRIHEFSRLARSTKDLLELVELFNERGITLISNKENLDTSTPTGKLMLTMIAAINEFERQQLLERQKEGIAIAKKNGIYKGSKAKEYDKAKLDRLNEAWKRKEITKSQFADEMGVTVMTLNKWLAA